MPSVRLLRRTVRASIAFVALGVLAAGVALVTTGRGDDPDTTRPDAVALALEADGCVELSCAEGAYSKLTTEYGASSALKYLTVATTSQSLRVPCHELAHAIGYVEMSLRKDAQTAMSYGSPLCNFGYYHGVATAAVKILNGPTFDAQIGEMCNAMPTTSTHLSCVHGLGHALSARANQSLSKAAELCSVFASDDERYYCFDGAVMQWTADLPTSAAEEGFAEGAPEAICALFESPFSRACYANIFDLYRLRGDTRDATWWGARVDACVRRGRDTEECVKGVAHAASADNDRGLLTGELSEVCSSAAGHIDTCLYIAARSHMVTVPDPAEYEEACRAVLPAHSARCDSFASRLREELNAVGDPRAQ